MYINVDIYEGVHIPVEQKQDIKHENDPMETTFYAGIKEKIRMMVPET